MILTDTQYNLFIQYILFKAVESSAAETVRKLLIKELNCG